MYLERLDAWNAEQMQTRQELVAKLAACRDSLDVRRTELCFT